MTSTISIQRSYEATKMKISSATISFFFSYFKVFYPNWWGDYFVFQYTRNFVVEIGKNKSVNLPR